MPRGAYIWDWPSNNVVMEIFEAATGLDLAYNNAGHTGAFVPDDFALIGDTWDGTVFSPDRTGGATLYVPYEITAFQARRALNAMGVRETFDMMLSGLSANSRDAWERSPTFERQSSVVEEILSAMGGTETDADNFFRLAATYKPEG